MTRDELIAAYAEWLGQYHWNVFATLTFRGFASSSRADRIYRKWISEMKEEDGKRDFCWVRVAEHGAFNDNLHYHCLIGGLHEICRWHWMRRWETLAGDSRLTYYRADYFNPDANPLHQKLTAAESDRPTGAIPYLLKTVHPDLDPEIDFELPLTTIPSPQHHRENTRTASSI